MLPIVATLLSSGMTLLGNAVMAKGQAVIEEKLGVKLDDMVSSDEGKIKLRQIEMEREAELHEFVLAQKEQDLKADAMAYADTANARGMQTAALAQSDVFSKRFIYYFAAAWSLMACLYIGFITFGQIPEQNVRFADTILGFILGTVVATILQFFFGTSKGSRDKDETMAHALKEMSK
jgi:hypothetical protein